MKKNLKAFTLVELVVAISIFFAMVIATYIPYAFYQNKAKVNITIKNIAQSINEARNFAINWLEKEVVVRDTSTVPTTITKVKKNLNVWILFNKEDKNQIQIFAYPYDMPYNEVITANMTNYVFTWTHKEVNENIFLIKTKSFLFPIKIQSLQVDLSDQDNIFILFDAIKWTPSIYKQNTDYSISTLTGDEVKITAAFKNAKPGPLRKELNYTPKTNLIDY